MTRFSSSADLVAAAGSHLGYSDWLEITQERINAFADATDDRQWIHVDPERAKAGPFGTTIAHGYLTLSLAVRFVDEIFAVEGVRMGVNYGANRVRFISPVPVGSRLRAGGVLVAVEDFPGGVQATLDLTFEIEGSERPACVAQVLYRLYL
ncbi:MAG TPA: MaoC family dehydratase [Acidimicrobiia bacterium]|jgi:acyl dehydratase|nr:MaoC family dehydratase [Acidimicrobiia bacterium]